FASGLLVAATAAALLVALPPSSSLVTPPDGVTATAAAPEWLAPVAAGGGPVKRVRVVSHLADAGSLPSGTAVATFSLERDGRPVAAWTLRVGDDTGEWAASRDDLRSVAAAGPIWWSWVPPGGGFFAHDYVATWQLSAPAAATALRIARDPALPSAATLAVLRVEVAP